MNEDCDVEIVEEKFEENPTIVNNLGFLSQQVSFFLIIFLKFLMNQLSFKSPYRQMILLKMKNPRGCLIR